MQCTALWLSKHGIKSWPTSSASHRLCLRPGKAVAPLRTRHDRCCTKPTIVKRVKDLKLITIATQNLAQQHILDIKLSIQYNWQYSNLFFRRLHTLGHLQPSTLLCHHVHLRPTESDYKNQQSVITNHTKLYLFSNRAKLTGWAHWPEGRCLRTNSLV